MSTIITTCPTCSGNGMLAQSGATLLCPTCSGGGGWLTDISGKRLSLPLPLTATPERLLPSLIPKIVTTLGATGLLLSTVAILSQGKLGLVELFWTRGFTHAAFSIFGLLFAVGMSSIQNKRISSLSLHHLEDLPEQSILTCLDPRISQLLGALEQTAMNVSQGEVTEAVLLIGLLETSRIQTMIARLEVDAQPIIAAISLQLTPQKSVTEPVINAQTRSRILNGCRLALNNNYPSVDLEDILLAFLDAPGMWEPLFTKFSIDLKKFRAVSDWYAADAEHREQWNFWLAKGKSRPNGYMNRAWSALPTRILDTFGTDLTQLASSGRLPSVSVREKEIQQLLEILGRTHHNSAILVGEAGVGKTTLLGGVALRMIEGNVPAVLQDKRLVLLEVSTLLSQAGNAEQNLEQILEEVQQAGNVILAIPDIHLLSGTSGAALDAAGLLGSALNRGSVQLISTARYADFHRYIETSPLLANALETIEIAEATVEQSVLILESEIPRLEAQHGVTISYPALEAAAKLAKRYLPEKILPTSAINLLDEVASAAGMAKNYLVTEAMVSQRITERTGVPIGEATQEQTDHLLNMEDELHSRVIGQELAVQAVSEAMRRAAAGLHQNNRPLASFLFVGPTGTGKTELAKALAELQFKRPDALLRFDMSEYQEGTAAYRLIGAPAGTSESATEGGVLTQAIREHPYSLILFDELEKADPNVLNLLLQLLDDGRLTENTGRTVQFSNCIVIATSNAGTQELTTMLMQNSDPDVVGRQSLAILQNYFKPELINRFDRIIPFLPLTEEEIESIAELQLAEIQRQMLEKEYTISFAPGVTAHLAKIGFDPVFGARPLRRAVQDKVEGVLANLILTKALQPGGMVEITPEMVQ